MRVQPDDGRNNAQGKHWRENAITLISEIHGSSSTRSEIDPPISTGNQIALLSR